MGTGHEVRDEFPWADSTGALWQVAIVWAEVRGRVEATSLTLDSDGQRALTSSVMRAVEGVVAGRRAHKVKQFHSLAGAGPEQVRRRAEKQLAVWQAAAKGKGSQRDDTVWLDRTLVMWGARRARTSMEQALRDHYDVLENTAHTWAKRCRAWDRETGLGLLTAGDPDAPAVIRRAVQAALAAPSPTKKKEQP